MKKILTVLLLAITFQLVAQTNLINVNISLPTNPDTWIVHNKFGDLSEISIPQKN